MRDEYDFILIDAPPSLGMLTLNTLAAADSVLIPIQCEFYALEGLSQLLNTVRIVQQNLNPGLQIEGVLLTMYDGRLNLSKQVAEEAKEYFGPKVYRTTIPRNVRIAEAPSFGEPIVLYDILSVGAKSYLSLAQEVIGRQRGSGARATGAAGDGREGRNSGWRAREDTQPAGEGAGRAARRVPSGGGGEGSSGYRTVAVARIAPNPLQPRREFTEAQLAELEASIRENGLLQPLVVRPATEHSPAGAEWELVAGERRWRAVRRLGWSEVPVVVREMDDRTLLVLAIVENVQREDLSPLDEAEGYRRLMEDFGYTQREVADTVGKDRSTVANLLRLLQLPASVQRLVTDGSLSMGHARALLGLEDERSMADLARSAVEKGLSVRAVEEQVRRRKSPPPARSEASDRAGGGDPHVRHLEGELQRLLGTAVRIHVARGETGQDRDPVLRQRRLRARRRRAARRRGVSRQ